MRRIQTPDSQPSPGKRYEFTCEANVDSSVLMLYNCVDENSFAAEPLHDHELIAIAGALAEIFERRGFSLLVDHHPMPITRKIFAFVTGVIDRMVNFDPGTSGENQADKYRANVKFVKYAFGNQAQILIKHKVAKSECKVDSLIASDWIWSVMRVATVSDLLGCFEFLRSNKNCKGFDHDSLGRWISLSRFRCSFELDVYQGFLHGADSSWQHELKRFIDLLTEDNVESNISANLPKIRKIIGSLVDRGADINGTIDGADIMTHVLLSSDKGVFHSRGYAIREDLVHLLEEMGYKFNQCDVDQCGVDQYSVNPITRLIATYVTKTLNVVVFHRIIQHIHSILCICPKMVVCDAGLEFRSGSMLHHIMRYVLALGLSKDDNIRATLSLLFKRFKYDSQSAKSMRPPKDPTLVELCIIYGDLKLVRKAYKLDTSLRIHEGGDWQNLCHWFSCTNIYPSEDIILFLMHVYGLDLSETFYMDGFGWVHMFDRPELGQKLLDKSGGYISLGTKSGISPSGECLMLKPTMMGGFLGMNNPMDNLETIYKQFIEKYGYLLLPEIIQSYSPGEFYGDTMEILIPQMLWNDTE